MKRLGTFGMSDTERSESRDIPFSRTLAFPSAVYKVALFAALTPVIIKTFISSKSKGKPLVTIPMHML